MIKNIDLTLNAMALIPSEDIKINVILWAFNCCLAQTYSALHWGTVRFQFCAGKWLGSAWKSIRNHQKRKVNSFLWFCDFHQELSRTFTVMSFHEDKSYECRRIRRRWKWCFIMRVIEFREPTYLYLDIACTEYMIASRYKYDNIRCTRWILEYLLTVDS